ncbi:MAG TPA: hypothetical protein VN364_03875, partial [Bellilinea sp.]|nr:hypothetical protein [Bellilinea sp.]
TITRFAISIALAILLTGCVKAEVLVDLRPNGSGTLSMSIGLTSEAKSMLSSQGSDIDTIFDGLISDDSSKDQIQVEKWVDGEYEWAKAGRDFENVEQITQLLDDNTMFTQFSLTQKKGFFQNQYTLNAEFAPLSADTSGSDASAFGMDAAAFIELRFITRMPGKIIESNGYPDKDNPNLISWTAKGGQPVSIKAESAATNWVNLGLVLGGAVLLIAVIFGITYSRKRKKQQIATDITAQPLPEEIIAP